MTSLKSYLEKPLKKVRSYLHKHGIKEEPTEKIENYLEEVNTLTAEEEKVRNEKEKEKDIEGKDLKKLKKLASFSSGAGSEMISSLFTGYPNPTLHEYGHKIAAELLGYNATIKGDTTYIPRLALAKSYSDNLAISLGGPLMSFGIAGAFHGLSRLAGKSNNDFLESYLRGISCYESALTSAFAFPYNTLTDGGKAAKALSEITPLNFDLSSLILASLLLLPTLLLLYDSAKSMKKGKSRLEEEVKGLAFWDTLFKDQKLEEMVEDHV